MDVKSTIETLVRDGFILVFNEDDLDVIKTAHALIEAGINNMEVTCRIKNPLDNMRRLRKELPNFMAGAGSLIDFTGMREEYNRYHGDDPLPTVERVVSLGMNYIVSAANFSPQAYDNFLGRVAIIPGCGTVTEILNQFSLVKFCEGISRRATWRPRVY